MHVLDESGKYVAECRRVVSERKVQVILGPWLMLRVWSFSVLGFYMRDGSSLLFFYGSETMISREKEFF